MGILTEERVLTITGRCKELYKLRNGKYVVPTQIEERISLSRFISQCMLFGADRDYNVCLLSLDEDATKGQDKDLEKLIENELNALNQGGYDWPKKFKIVPGGFTVENGLLTPKMSLKRPVITKKFMDVLEEMYDE